MYVQDLILEKKFLQKETNKLKNLNSHLESRLGQQEKRLGAVSIELNKTWSLVGRMQVINTYIKSWLISHTAFIFDAKVWLQIQISAVIELK